MEEVTWPSSLRLPVEICMALTEAVELIHEQWGCMMAAHDLEARVSQIHLVSTHPMDDPFYISVSSLSSLI
jgi:hypothetical protein